MGPLNGLMTRVNAMGQLVNPDTKEAQSFFRRHVVTRAAVVPEAVCGVVAVGQNILIGTFQAVVFTPRVLGNVFSCITGTECCQSASIGNLIKDFLKTAYKVIAYAIVTASTVIIGFAVPSYNFRLYNALGLNETLRTAERERISLQQQKQQELSNQSQVNKLDNTLKASIKIEKEVEIDDIDDIDEPLVVEPAPKSVEQPVEPQVQPIKIELVPVEEPVVPAQTGSSKAKDQPAAPAQQPVVQPPQEPVIATQQPSQTVVVEAPKEEPKKTVVEALKEEPKMVKLPSEPKKTEIVKAEPEVVQAAKTKETTATPLDVEIEEVDSEDDEPVKIHYAPRFPRLANAWNWIRGHKAAEATK